MQGGLGAVATVCGSPSEGRAGSWVLLLTHGWFVRVRCRLRVRGDGWRHQAAAPHSCLPGSLRVSAGLPWPFLRLSCLLWSQHQNGSRLNGQCPYKSIYITLPTHCSATKTWLCWFWHVAASKPLCTLSSSMHFPLRPTDVRLCSPPMSNFSLPRLPHFTFLGFSLCSC